MFSTILANPRLDASSSVSNVLIATDAGVVPLGDGDDVDATLAKENTRLALLCHREHPFFRNSSPLSALPYNESDVIGRYIKDHRAMQRVFKKIPKVDVAKVVDDHNVLPVKYVDGVVSLETNLSLSEWSLVNGFIHGSDTLIPMGRLARELLDEGETIMGIKKLRYNDIMTTQLAMSASLEPFPKSGAKRAIVAEFTTSQGRIFYVQATANGQPVNAAQILGIDENVVRAVSYFDEPFCDETKSKVFFPLTSSSIVQSGKTTETPNPLIETMRVLEILNKAVLSWQREVIQFLVVGINLVGGFSDLVLPPSSFWQRPQTGLRFTLAEAPIQTAKGFSLYSIGIEFLARGDSTTGGPEMVSRGVIHHAVPDVALLSSAMLLEKLRQK